MKSIIRKAVGGVLGESRYHALAQRYYDRLEQRHDAAELARGIGSDLFAKVLRSVSARNRTELHTLGAFNAILEMAAEAGKHGRWGRVLELGAYSHPGLALALLLNGAEHVSLNNLTPIRNRLEVSYVNNLVFFMNLFGLGRRDLRDLIRPVSDGQGLMIDEKWLTILPPQSAGEITLPEESLDFIFSITVFEHVAREDVILVHRNCRRMLRPGGYCYHSVDLRDHRDMFKPLEFLRLSEEQFQAAVPEGFNRLRLGDHEEAVREAGLNVDRIWVCGPIPLDPGGATDLYELMREPRSKRFVPIEKFKPWVTEAVRQTLHPDYYRRSLAELSVTGVDIVCRK